MSQIIQPHDASLTSLAELSNSARIYAEQAKSANTVRAYRNDWRDFTAWCTLNNLSSLPAAVETVALYLTAQAASCKISTMARRLTSISVAHKVSGFTSPSDNEQLRTVWQGIRRSKGVSRIEKRPILTNELRLLFEYLPSNLMGARDRAIVLLGYSGGFRRSELVGLDRKDVVTVQEGLIINVRRSKTDQLGSGVQKGIPYGSSPDLCPVRALLAWIEATPQVIEPLFVSIGKGERVHAVRLSGKAVSLVVKRLMDRAGMNAAEYSGHSLRSGFATQAALNGASDREIMRQTGHRSSAMVSRYVRIASLWKENGATKLGL